MPDIGLLQGPPRRRIAIPERSTTPVVAADTADSTDAPRGVAASFLAPVGIAITMPIAVVSQPAVAATASPMGSVPTSAPRPTANDGAAHLVGPLAGVPPAIRARDLL